MLYWIMSMPLELLQVRIERYYGKGFAGEKAGSAPPGLHPRARASLTRGAAHVAPGALMSPGRY